MSEPSTHGGIQCPIHSPYDVEPCDPEELGPLLRHLEADYPVAGSAVFPRGTVLADGRLDLCKQSLGPGGCRMVTAALAKNTRVRSLLLGTDGIGDRGAEDVAALVDRNPRLQTIYLGCNRITAQGAARLCEVLEENRTVTGLWLKRNPVGPEGAAAVARMLRRNRRLRVLDLVNTGIGAAGLARVLAALIEENRTLERLYLGGNEIDGAETAELLARLLRVNPAIRALLLNVNFLGDSGARRLASALEENRTLEELGLASCGITHAGAAALFGALPGHPALRQLDLGYSVSTRVLGAPANPLGDAGARAVAGFLNGDPPLQRLDLRRTGIGLKGRASLAEALRTNGHLVELLHDGPQDPRLSERLRRNRETAEAWRSVPAEVAMIRSVYRTDRRGSQDAREAADEPGVPAS